MDVVIPTWGLNGRHGGVRVLCELANGLRARGHAVRLLAFDEESQPAFETVAEVVRIGRSPGGRNVLRDWPRQRLLRRAIERFPGADVVLANQHLTAAPTHRARVRARKYYYVQAWETDFYPRRLRHALQRRTASASYRLPLRPIANCAAVARQAFGARAAGVPIVPPGVDPALYHPQHRPPPGNPPRVGVIGREEHWKGTPDAFAAVRLARAAGLAIDFRVAFGVVPGGCEDVAHTAEWPRGDRAVAEWYRSLDVVISPAWFGGAPYPPIEAMACGTAVVATPSDHVADGVDALTAPDHDPEGLARALTRMLREPDLRARLVAAGLARARGHHWDSVVGRMEAILTGGSDGRDAPGA